MAEKKEICFVKIKYKNYRKFKINGEIWSFAFVGLNPRLMSKDILDLNSINLEKDDINLAFTNCGTK